MWWEWLVVAGSLAALFGAGWAFLRLNLLYNDFEEQSTVVQVWLPHLRNTTLNGSDSAMSLDV